MPCFQGQLVSAEKQSVFERFELKAVSQYRLGNRSALEWVIDQYQVSEDKRSGIRSDPNPADDPEYIVRLVGQVVRVSLETVGLGAGLPGLSNG